MLSNKPRISCLTQARQINELLLSSILSSEKGLLTSFKCDSQLLIPNPK